MEFGHATHKQKRDRETQSIGLKVIAEHADYLDATAMCETLDEDLPRTALVIEDTACIRQMTIRMLRKLGCETFEACGGKQGLGMLQQRTYSICTCDVEMPVMDGLECVSRLRAWEALNRPHSAQLVVCVSSRTDVLKDRLLEVGMDDAVQIPLQYEKLKSLISLETSSLVSSSAQDSGFNSDNSGRDD